MRSLSTKEMVLVFRVARSCFFGGGSVLLVFGAWYLASPLVYHVDNPVALLGIFPIYIGGMLILVAFAMKEDWFTDARRYW
jgi:uncharacterized membrane protein HdeD (DUF308 family)